MRFVFAQIGNCFTERMDRYPQNLNQTEPNEYMYCFRSIHQINNMNNLKYQGPFHEAT